VRSVVAALSSRSPGSCTARPHGRLCETIKRPSIHIDEQSMQVSMQSVHAGWHKSQAGTEWQRARPRARGCSKSGEEGERAGRSIANAHTSSWCVKCRLGSWPWRPWRRRRPKRAKVRPRSFEFRLAVALQVEKKSPSPPALREIPLSTGAVGITRVDFL
jgi:hypothetical protein